MRLKWKFAIESITTKKELNQLAEKIKTHPGVYAKAESGSFGLHQLLFGCVILLENTAARGNNSARLAQLEDTEIFVITNPTGDVEPFAAALKAAGFQEVSE